MRTFPNFVLNGMKHFLTHILRCDTPSRNMNKKVDHWLDPYIIMPAQSLISSFLEESLFVTVQSSPGFINQNNVTRCCLNATLQLLYFNVIFRQLILNIDYYIMMIGL